MGKIKRVLVWFAILFAAHLLLSLPVSAAEAVIPNLKLNQQEGKLTDGYEKSPATVSGDLTVHAETPISTLYLIYYTQPADFVLIANGKEIPVSGKFLRQTVDVTQLVGASVCDLTMRFSGEASLTEVNAFPEGELPHWVQIWSEPEGKADLCLMTTHADDEQLFFAGVLPYYAGEKNFEVQVIYFTDHINEPFRRHELLMGLWAVGVDRYPVIGPVPDRYSTTLNQAQSHANSAGLDREKVVSFQVEMLRRFQPLVVVGHDPEGEYGHGQHKLNSSTLQEAVNRAGKSEDFPDSAAKYGTWEVPKTYLHSYAQNPIVMDWDVPLARFGGKTAFQVTQEGFSCHGSQQYTWFRTWLTGNGSITKASQIKTYSPCNYGLFRSNVGEDVKKNDFFENLKSYEQQRLEEEARIQKEMAQRTETVLYELKEKLCAAQKDGGTVLEEKRLAAEAAALERRLEKEKEKRMAFGCVLLAGILVLIVMLLFFYRRKKRRFLR